MTPLFAQIIILDQICQVSGIWLLWEYIKFNFRDDVVRRASTKWFISDLCDNVYYIWSLVLMKYLVDQAEIAIAKARGAGAGMYMDSSGDDGGGDAEGDSGFAAGENDSARRLLRAAVRHLSTDQDFMLTFTSYISS